MAHLTLRDIAEAVKTNPALKDCKLMLPSRNYPGGFCSCCTIRTLDSLPSVAYMESDCDAPLEKWGSGMQVVVPMTFGDRLLRAVLGNEDDGTWQDIVRIEANKLDAQERKTNA